MTCYRFFIFIFLLNFIAYKQTKGQIISPAQSSLQNSETYFQNEIGPNAHIYTGKQYVGYEVNIKGNPFYSSNEMQNSNIFYDGVLYKNVPLLYDIVRQEVVINRFHQNFRIKLLNEKISYFTLASHQFESIDVTDKSGAVINTLYDVIYNGKIMVLVKRNKIIMKGFKADDPSNFIEEDEFYIKNNNSFYQVNNNNSLLRALNDKREFIETYVQKNKFRFKKDIEKELLAIAAYYSTL